MAKKKDKPGILERARRGVAKDTLGETGFGTTLKRGVALISSLAQEAAFPSKNSPSRASLKRQHERKLATKGEKKKSVKKKKDEIKALKAEKNRKPVEKATGTSKIKSRLEGLSQLTKAAAKREKK